MEESCTSIELSIVKFDSNILLDNDIDNNYKKRLIGRECIIIYAPKLSIKFCTFSDELSVAHEIYCFSSFQLSKYLLDKDKFSVSSDDGVAFLLIEHPYDIVRQNRKRYSVDRLRKLFFYQAFCVFVLPLSSNLLSKSILRCKLNLSMGEVSRLPILGRFIPLII